MNEIASPDPTNDGVERVLASIDMMYQMADLVHDRFAEIAAENPEVAAEKFREFMDEARDLNSDSYTSSDPNPDWLLPIINTVGIDYANFAKPLRRTVVEGFTSGYSGVNFRYIQWFHTPKIECPELLRDICTYESLFFPDMTIVDNLIPESESIDDLVAKGSCSELLVGMKLACPITEDSPDPVKVQTWREQAAKSKPRLLPGAIKVLAATDYLQAQRIAERSEKTSETILDRMVGKRIDPIYEAEWRAAMANPEEWITSGVPT